MVDCGAGVLSRLFAVLPVENLTGVILSHLHSDHVNDFFVLRYALEVARHQGRRVEPLPVWAPAEPSAEFARLAYRDVITLNGVTEGEELMLGRLRAAPFPGKHSLPVYGWRFQFDDSVLVYSADTEYDPRLVFQAEGADLFLCEATFTAAQLDQGLKGHLSGQQAAMIAREAQVGRLLLTHLSPAQDLNVVLAEARAEFLLTELAEEGKVYTLTT
ncbi:MAG: MBL fold metallo-hydrolase [Firmicutes bacterium]|nr:MBL fold metallo-hydrolase [Bacillota bacterium]